MGCKPRIVSHNNPLGIPLGLGIFMGFSPTAQIPLEESLSVPVAVDRHPENTCTWQRAHSAHWFPGRENLASPDVVGRPKVAEYREPGGSYGGGKCGSSSGSPTRIVEVGTYTGTDQGNLGLW